MTREDRGASSFDELASGLASGTLSRGKALKLMGAALLGGTLASIPGIAMAKPKPADRKCNHDHQCESGQCVDGVCGGGEPCGGCPADCVCVVNLDTGVQTCVVRCDVSPCQADVTDCNQCISDFVCFAEGTSLTCARPCS